MSGTTWGGYAPAFETIIISDTAAQDAAIAVPVRPTETDLLAERGFCCRRAV